jgi:methylthioribulose 1-phosphate dehydratase/enolase-phosphatase E1
MALLSPGAPYPSVAEARILICDLCAAFYRLGWVSGTGGGMSLRAQGGRIVMAPSVRRCV